MPGVARAGSKRHPYRRRRRGAARARPHANGTPVLAAIDVGTNACRLLIAVPESDSSRGHMLVPRVIDSFTANVRLGESLERTGTITGRGTRPDHRRAQGMRQAPQEAARHARQGDRDRSLPQGEERP